MAGQLFILRQVADFAPGFFDDTVLEGECIHLSRRLGAFAKTGSYTSVPFSAEAFFSLIPSWNADVPRGTSVEMQVRVAADGHWSQWFSFGAFCPYSDRASPPPQADEVARVAVDSLTVQYGQPAATTAQMRVLLTTEDEQVSPMVRLLAVSTNASRQIRKQSPAYDRVLEVPAYSCLNRDPAIAGKNGGATTLTMLMNRWGRDLLPDEVARAGYDSGAGIYHNLAFLCAVAGSYGFYSSLAFAGIEALRREVWQGRAVGARVRYQAPALGEEPAAKEGRGDVDDELPVLEGAVQNSAGHLVAVCGFVKGEDGEEVIINDPFATSDTAVRRQISLADFAEIYTGIALYLDRGARGAGKDSPMRQPAFLRVEDSALKMFADGEELVPAKLLDGSLSPATLCYTLSDGVAYASAAQRKFYYPGLDGHGVVRFDRSVAVGKKLTLYLIGANGATWVAEKQEL
ncbi:MAG: hypothetical protein AB7V55_01570 [Oscillospiraceae bacterium]